MARERARRGVAQIAAQPAPADGGPRTTAVSRELRAPRCPGSGPQLVVALDQLFRRRSELCVQIIEVGSEGVPLKFMVDRGLGILHYDSEYDLPAEKTDLGYAGVWLADRGSL
jgi:hypothetical protein